jgi:hypothetical protein
MSGTIALPAFASPLAAVPLLQALRQARRSGPGRVVLRVEEPAPHRRRIARALLQEGALAAGGQVMDGPAGDLLLVGAEAHRADRLRGLLERLVRPAGTLIWSLDRDGEALAAYTTGRAAPPAPRPEGPALADLDGFLDALPLAQVLRRLEGRAVGAGATRFLRLAPDRAAVVAALGTAGHDPDLVAHALHRLALRLRAALGRTEEAAALLGSTPARRLHLPAEAVPAAANGPLPTGLVATLPLALLGDAAALARRMAALDSAGIAAELDGLDAAALGLLDPAALPPCRLRLHWSPALAAPDSAAALALLDPTRLALAGADGEAAVAFATRLGIAQVEVPAT